MERALLEFKSTGAPCCVPKDSPLRAEKITPRTLAEIAEQASLYAILDACDAPLVPAKMKELGAAAASLFQGTAREDYWAVAPYLAQVDINLLRWLFENVWREPWGVFVIANAELSELSNHLRSLLFVHAEGGRNLFFRYYDPRVLSRYLASCDGNELRAFYGPASGFATANDREIVRYRLA